VLADIDERHDNSRQHQTNEMPEDQKRHEVVMWTWDQEVRVIQRS